LTAAHCVTRFSASDVKNLKIYLGAHNIRTGPRSEHRVRRIIRFKDYNPRIYILSRRFACLPALSSSSYVNERVTATGWGLLDERGRRPSSVLQEFDLTTISNARCVRKYRRRDMLVDDSMMCASEPGKDACDGDSGGPMFLSGSDLQVGITSWGYGCARADSPGVYTRLTKFVDWIQHIQNCY